MTTPIIIFSLCFLALSLIRLDYALFFLAAALPAYTIRFSIFGLPSTLLEIMILIIFASWFFKQFLPQARKRLKGRSARISYPFAIEIMLLVIFSFAAAGITGFNLGALGIWKAYFFEPILVFILIINLCQEKKDRQRLIGALLIGAAGVAVMAVWQKLTGQFILNPFWADAATRRVVSWFGYPNAVGLYLAPLILLAIGWFFSQPHRANLSQSAKKILIILVIAASLSAVYFAKSEGALIGIAAGLIIFGLFAGKRQRIITAALALTVIVGVFSYAPTREFAINKLTLHDLSGEIRRRQWKETLLALTGPKIITGAGLDNYQAAVAPYHQEGIFFNSDNLPNFDEQLRASAELRAKYWQPVEIYLYPHNIFLNFWSEIGLIGAIVFMWLLSKALFLALRAAISGGREKQKERYIALGLASALVAIIVHGLVDVPYFKNDLSVMFWILLALIGLYNLDRRSSDYHDQI